MVAGMLEGVGLLIFQRINWARWGPTLHVSERIVWVSAVTDVGLFLLVAIIVGGLAHYSQRLPAIRVVAFALTFFTLYDWLSVTDRLYQRACILLALGIAAAFTRWLIPRETAFTRFWRSTLPWLLAILVVFAGLIEVSARLREDSALADLPVPTADAPNVVVIVVDTLRADHLSTYGYPRKTSPNLDRIAEEGVLFENAISASSWTLPSHASLMTGCNVSRHGIGTVHPLPLLDPVRPGLGGLPTLGEALMRSGYRTGAFSANRTWFVHDLGFGRGFMHFEDYFYSFADTLARTFYGRELLRNYVKRIAKSRDEGLLRYGHAFGLRKRAEVINRELLEWIDADSRRPFLAFVNYLDVHDPYGTPEGYWGPSWLQTNEIDRYDAGIGYVDDFIGKLWREIKGRSQVRKTLIVITSDHGEALGQHSMEGHGRALYWEQIHVPLLIWYPEHVPFAQRIPVPVSSTSIPSTVLQLLRAEAHPAFCEPALSALWQNSDALAKWEAPISELVQDKYSVQQDSPADLRFATAKTGFMKSLVSSRWHLIVHEKAGAQIYDWKSDPGEIHDLARTATGEAAIRELLPHLNDLTRRSIP
jgi:arylsulfatase A-like enzyme